MATKTIAVQFDDFLVKSVTFKSYGKKDRTSRPFSFTTPLEFIDAEPNGNWSGKIYWDTTSNHTDPTLIGTVTNGKFSLNSSWTVAVEDRTIYIYGKEDGGGGGPTPKEHYYYQVKLYGNGGVFSDNSKTYTTYWWPKDDVASSETTSPKVNTSTFPSPTRTGYRLTGWAKTSNGTPTSPLTFTAKSTDADNPTVGNAAYAIWQVRPHIILDANGGKFDGTLSTKDFYINYGDGLDFSRYKPSWYGEGSYTLIGWAENPTSTSPTYGVNEVIGPLYGAGPYKYFAVWQKSRATLTFYGNGGLWYGNLQKQSKTYEVGETVSFATYSNNLVRAGYSLLGWSTSPTATAAPWDPNDIVTVGATDADYYAVWQKHIDLFYWYGNDTQDAAKIAKDQPVTNLTATIWNEFKSRINQLTIAKTGKSWSYSAVSLGDSITATEVLAARDALAALDNNVPLPTANQLQTGKQILASYFNGPGSLKAALNIIIKNYNKLIRAD